MKTIIAFLIIFSVIVVIHEFGHYYMAKRAGIRVREFAIGMGPKLFAKQDKNGTTYTIRMIPLGGYVRLAGLNEEEFLQPGMTIGLRLDDQDRVVGINLSKHPQVDELPVQVDAFDMIDAMTLSVIPIGQEEVIEYVVDHDAIVTEPDGTQVLVSPRNTRYESVSPWNKFKVNVAGPINNFVLAIVTYSLIAFIIGSVPTTQPKIGEVVENSPAQTAGLQSGDEILSVNGTVVQNWQELVTIIQNAPNEKLAMQVQRGQQELAIEVEVSSVKDETTDATYGQIGVQVYRDTSLTSKLMYGFTQTWSVIAMVVTTILGMFKTGFQLNQFGGPVAIAQMTNTVVQHGYLNTLAFMAMLSANLGVMNLLPIPGLDGGKIVLNIYEALRGKPLPQEKEGLITLIGVVILVIFILAVTFNDIMRAFF